MARQLQDHKFFAGGKHEHGVLPKGVHHEKHPEHGHASSHKSGMHHSVTKPVVHAGGNHEYPDTADKIHANQKRDMAKIHGHTVKPGDRV